MTLPAAGELLQHLRRMRGAMAILAGRNHLVFFLVTGSALQSMMLGRACLQQFVGLIMAGGTLCGCNLLCVDHRQRIVRAVTGDTIGLHHILGMGLMALDTLRDITMRCRMTIDALQALVLGLAGIEGLENAIVAGTALDRRNLVAVNNRNRAVCRVAELALVGCHCRRMRLMTLVTLGDLAVLLFVTGGARNLAVFGRAVGQDIVNLIMTGAAVRGRNIRGIGDGQRLVRLMTGVASGLDHGCAMGFVAIGTIGDVAMGVFVAGGTKQCRVFTREILELRPLTSVTGQTGGGKIFTENDLQGAVGVFVTAQAAFDLVVGGAAVALATGRDNFQRHRGMTFMTVLATDTGLVRLAGLFNILGHITMAFAAIAVEERRSRS